MQHHFIASHAFALLIGALPMVAAHAQTAPVSVNVNMVDAGVLSGASGNIAVNTSAGNGTAQSNHGAIGAADGIAFSALDSHQILVSPPPTPSDHSAVVRGNAFSQVSGMVRFNQSSGSGNAQANMAAIAHGSNVEISLQQLAQVGAPSLPQQPANSSGNGRIYRAEIADTAFEGARGIVQVNQVAGSGNSTANLFALGVSTASP